MSVCVYILLCFAVRCLFACLLVLCTVCESVGNRCVCVCVEWWWWWIWRERKEAMWKSNSECVCVSAFSFLLLYVVYTSSSAVQRLIWERKQKHIDKAEQAYARTHIKSLYIYIFFPSCHMLLLLACCKEKEREKKFLLPLLPYEWDTSLRL